MSISGGIAMALLRLIHPGKGSYKDLDALRARAAKENAAFRFKEPHGRSLVTTMAEGLRLPCPVISPAGHAGGREDSGARPASATLYIYGGVVNTWKSQLRMAERFARDTGADVWYPVYPALSEVNVVETITYLADVYRRMTKRYSPERIALVGLSLGGMYALGIVSAINELGLRVPMPGLVIAHSPGASADNEEDWRLFSRYEVRDPFFAATDLRMVGQLTPPPADGSTPGWALYPARGDFHGAPPTYLYYGEEMLAGGAELYRRAFARSGTEDRLHVTITKNMMHCYSCLPIFPESKVSYRETVNLVRQL